jgi:hypothetical protein
MWLGTNLMPPHMGGMTWLSSGAYTAYMLLYLGTIFSIYLLQNPPGHPQYWFLPAEEDLLPSLHVPPIYAPPHGIGRAFD